MTKIEKLEAAIIIARADVDAALAAREAAGIRFDNLYQFHAFEYPAKSAKLGRLITELAIARREG